MANLLLGKTIKVDTQLAFKIACACKSKTSHSMSALRVLQHNVTCFSLPLRPSKCRVWKFSFKPWCIFAYEVIPHSSWHRACVYKPWQCALTAGLVSAGLVNILTTLLTISTGNIQQLTATD